MTARKGQSRVRQMPAFTLFVPGKTKHVTLHQIEFVHYRAM